MNNQDLVATLEYLEDRSSVEEFWFRLTIDNQLPIPIWHVTLVPSDHTAPAFGSVALGGVLAPIVLAITGPMRRGILPHGFNPPPLVELEAGQKGTLDFKIKWPIQEESDEFKMVSIESGRTVEWFAIIGFMFTNFQPSQLTANHPRAQMNQFVHRQKTLFSNIVETKVP